MNDIIVRTFAFRGHGHSLPVAWLALDTDGNLVLADDVESPGSSVVNAALQATTRARQLVRAGRTLSPFSQPQWEEAKGREIRQVWVVDSAGIPCRYDPDADRLIDNEVHDDDAERADLPAMKRALQALRAGGWQLEIAEDAQRIADPSIVTTCHTPGPWPERAYVRYTGDESRLVVADERPAGADPLGVEVMFDEAAADLRRRTGMPMEQAWLLDADLRLWLRGPGKFTLCDRTDPFLDACVRRMLHDGWCARGWPGR